jgi:hypothetical protein
MPRYFIDLHDGSQHIRDKEGFEAANVDAVQKRVVGIMREVAQGFEPSEGHQQCTAAVRDEGSAVLFRARLSLDLDWSE